MTSYSSGGQTPTSVHHSYHSLSAKSSEGAIRGSQKLPVGSQQLPVDGNENVSGSKKNLSSSRDIEPVQNGGIEMTPLIVVAGNSDEEGDTAGDS